jgi:two-component system NtrC family sensor kinase
MRLRSNIFLWVSLATVVPLTAIVLLAAAAGERRQAAEVDRQVGIGLNAVVAEFERHLTLEREVVAALAIAPPMRRYAPVLAAARERRRHEEFSARSEELADFLRSFQFVLRDVGSVRVLDMRGNTLVRVRLGEAPAQNYEGIDPYPYAEPELNDAAFAARLAGLPADEVNHILLPASRGDFEEGEMASLLGSVVPLRAGEDGRVGYLVVSSNGRQIQRILERSAMPFDARLLVAELNPDSPERDGLLLHDARLGVLFAEPKGSGPRLADVMDGALPARLAQAAFGAFSLRERDLRVFYSEYLPYPNQLISWLVTATVDLEAVRAPYARIRAGILVFAGTALVLALGLAQIGARRVARPITELAEGLKAYAEGRRPRLPLTGATEEIRDLRRAFAYMADRLELAREERDRAERMLLQSAKLASIGEMAAGIGHELNNPLTNILSLTKLMGRALPPGSEALEGDLRALEDEAERASRIVRGVLNFARQVPPRFAPVHAADWLRETIGLVAQSARDREVAITSEVARELEFEADAAQLQQVLINLLLNAIQASEKGGEVHVELRRHNEEIELRVIDHGPGVPREHLDKIFDPFFTTKPPGEGSGLGLSVSLGIVEQHGGRLWLSNNPEGGAIATVRLPAQALESRP